MPVDDSYSKALLHFNGADASTTFTDEAGNSWSQGGTAQLDDAQSVFGGTSLLIPASAYIYANLSAALDLAANNFCIDFRVRFSALPGSGSHCDLVNFYNTNTHRLTLQLNNTGGTYSLYVYGSNAGGTILSASFTFTSLATGTWYHFAFVRTGNIYRLFKDGTQVGSDATAAGTYSLSAGKIGIASEWNVAGAGGFLGWFDEFRLSIETARWTTTFTPPASEYPHSITGLTLSTAPALSVTVGGDPYIIVPSGLTLSVAPAISATPYLVIDVQPGPLSVAPALDVGAVMAFTAGEAVITYECVLTGDADGLPDIELPMSSFQGRFRSGDPSYLSVVIPGTDCAEDIDDRSNGNLRLYMVKTSGAYALRELLCVVDLETVQVDDGPTSQSITLSGHRTETHAAKTVTFSDIFYTRLQDGLLRIRCKPDLYLRPGDTVVTSEYTITADLISWAVGVGQETMEISEEA
jgi:hypothetical protein